MKGVILVVDDDRQMVKTLCAVLRVHGWDTVPAYSGDEAVRVATDRSLTAVLMDVKMPGMNGVDAFQEIRRIRPRIPVILMTAYSAHELLAQAERAGVVSILPKPVPIQELNELLGAAIESLGTLLVVDDDPAFLRTLGEVLARVDRPCLLAHSLGEALDLLTAKAPGVVLLDLKLDHVQPRDAALAIKRMCPEVVLILCSGYPHMLDDAMAELPEGWVYAGLKKPFAPEQLIRLLDGVNAH